MAEENLPLEFTPMGDAFAEEPKKETTFTSDIRGIEKASEALEESRAAEKETIERKYVQVGGEHDGEDMPPDRSINLKRAVADISRQRDWEKTVSEQQGAEVLANEVDAYRAAEQAKQQPQQQAQPEVQAQISPDQIPDGVDIEVVQALTNNPKLRAAVEKEVIAADQSRMQYANATRAAAQVALASVLAQYPEIQGLSAEQLPVALQIMQAQNPQRASEVASHLQRAEQIYRLHEQAQGQNAAILKAQLQQWSIGEDQKVDQHLASEPPEVVRSVKDNLVKVMSETYGISKDELAHAFATTPILRAAPFQRALYDLVKHHMSNAQITEKKYRDAPPHIRPGTSSDRPSRDEAEAGRAYRKFISDPNPRSAAEFIMSKRSARR